MERFDLSGRTRQEIAVACEELIDRHGVVVVSVEGDGTAALWSHTLGLSLLDLPELLVTGPRDPHQTERVLREIAGELKTARGLGNPMPRPGAIRRTCVGTVDAEVVEVRRPLPHLALAVQLFGPSLRALQLVLTDESGCWPWDLGYLGPHQPLLGARTTPGPAGPAGR